MFLALSTALQVVHALTEPQYFLQPRQLFPVWPQWRPELAIAPFSTIDATVSKDISDA